MEKFEATPKNIDNLEIETIDADIIDSVMREVFGNNYKDPDIELVEDEDWNYDDDVIYFD